MPKYYLQKAESADGKTIVRYRGKQDKHNHTMATEFSKAIRSLWLADHNKEPELGTFRSGQSSPPFDVELKWNATYRTWEIK